MAVNTLQAGTVYRASSNQWKSMCSVSRIVMDNFTSGTIWDLSTITSKN